jgi:hypothetical protein
MLPAVIRRRRLQFSECSVEKVCLLSVVPAQAGTQPCFFVSVRLRQITFAGMTNKLVAFLQSIFRKNSTL